MSFRAAVRNLHLALLICLVTAAHADSGFVPIFNGKDLSGWVVMGDPAGFEVRDGCIYSEGGKNGQGIRTVERYGNFILRMDCMLSQTGNSGVFIRIGEGTPNMMEVQLLAPWTPYRDDLHCTGSIYGHVAVANRPDETTLKWRRMEIRAIHKMITVFVDGMKCCEGCYDQTPSMRKMPLVGSIGMQDSHTGPGEWVKFRNIEIRDLDRDPAFVMQSLSSTDPAIRATAYDASVRLGPTVIASLLDLARGDDTEAHVAEMALTRIVLESSADRSSEKCAQIRDALLSRLESGRDDAMLTVKLLGFAGTDDQPTLTALKTAWRKGGRTAEAVLESLRRIEGANATDALLDLLPESKNDRRVAVILALGERKDRRAIAPLAAIARSEDGDAHRAAIRALGASGRAEAVEVLRRIAERDANSREDAVNALIALVDYPIDDWSRRAALDCAREHAVSEPQKTAVGAK